MASASTLVVAVVCEDAGQNGHAGMVVRLRACGVRVVDRLCRSLTHVVYERRVDMLGRTAEDSDDSLRKLYARIEQARHGLSRSGSNR